MIWVTPERFTFSVEGERGVGPKEEAGALARLPAKGQSSSRAADLVARLGRGTLQYHHSISRLCLVLLLANPGQVASAEKEAALTARFATTEVEFHNGDVTLAGSLVVPSTEGPHPAIVFLHGSGPMTRASAASYSERYADLGFASLAYDKRGTGGSSGSWLSASLADLARDAVAAMDWLEKRADIDPERIGFWGVSQAGWVATQATKFTADVAFMVIISGGGASPYESEIFSYRTAFEQAGLSAKDQAAGMAMIEKYFGFMATGEGRQDLAAGLEAAAGSAWLPHARLDRILPSNEQGRLVWSWVATWDPRPLMEEMTFPILLLFGERDTQTPTALSVERWRESLEKAGNENFTIKLFPEAGHGIRLGHHGADAERPPFAEGYHETMDGWLAALSGREKSLAPGQAKPPVSPASHRAGLLHSSGRNASPPPRRSCRSARKACSIPSGQPCSSRVG